MTDHDDEDDDICSQCGHPRSEHGIDQRTLEPTKCPVKRQEKTTPPQEYQNTPKGDY